MPKSKTSALVAVLMGSKSDWETMRHAVETLDELGAAHLAGVIAAHTILPVLGVPMQSKLQGLDSLLSTAQMPGGIPVGTLAIGDAGAKNAALLAAAIIATHDKKLRTKLEAFRKKQSDNVLSAKLPK